MGQGYQKRDYHIIDYQLTYYDGLTRPFRGGAKVDIDKGNYVVCVGAAQTFGCYTPEPYPTLVHKKLGVDVLNLGVAGAGPSFFLHNPRFLELINKGRCLLLQVMSGRSVSNRLFKSKGGEMLEHRLTGKRIGAGPMYREFLTSSSINEIKSLISETRENWIREYKVLIEQVRIPVVLLWFSVRKPDYEIDNYKKVGSVFSDFPQLVNEEMINEVRTSAEQYIEVVSSRGMPQPLIDRFTGKPTTINMRKDLGGKKKYSNDYYPSPEMHEDVVEEILRLEVLSSV